MDKLCDTLKDSVPKKDYVEQQKQLRVALVEVEKLIRENTFNLNEVKSLQKRLDGQDLLIGDLQRESSVHKTVQEELVGEVEKWKESVTAVALESQEVENNLKTVLKECVRALETGGHFTSYNSESKTQYQFSACLAYIDAITHATALLENTEPPQYK